MPQKYQKEIEEILRQAGELSTGPSPKRRPQGFLALAWTYVTESVGGNAWSLSPGRVMLIGGSLLLSALIVQAVAPGLVGIFAWAGLILLILGYAMFFVRPRRMEKRWRGQPIDYRGDTLWSRLRRKLK